MRSRDYDLHITLDQLYQFIKQALLGVFSILDIWVKINRIREISLRHLRQNIYQYNVSFASYKPFKS